MKLLLAAAFVVLTGASCVGAVLWAHYYVGTNSTPAAVTFACKQRGATHQVVIENNQLSVAQIDGHLCDTMTIINEDDRIRLMAFGKHDHHQPYDGVVEKVLSKGESLTITFDQLGNFLFHDHLEDQVHGTFTVRTSP